MSNEKMREEFQERFPVPAGVEWRDAAYRISNPKQITMGGHIFYLGRWETWQASRAAIEVELPESFVHETEGFLEPIGSAVYVDDLKKVLDTLGLKVKS